MTNDRNTLSRILDAAECLVLQEGFHGVSVDRIISAAGVSKGTFFYHFPTKDALPSALLQRFLTRQGAEIQKVFADVTAAESDPLARALKIINGIAPLFAKAMQGAPGCVMAAFSYQLTQDFPDLQAISRASIEGWRGAFGALLEPLCQKQPDAPASRLLAEHLLCCLQGASVLARVERQPAVVQRAADQFCSYLKCLFSGLDSHTPDKYQPPKR